jgi:outer membrane protein TolC
LEQQLVQRYISQQQRRAARAETLPQVSLVAGYGVRDTIDEDDEFRDSFSIGAQLQWRLFDGGASRASADQSEIDVAIAEERFADTRNQVRFEVEQSYFSLQSNFDNIQTATLAVSQANEALRLARLRFGAGVGTQTDVLRSQTELAEAELNLVRAILGYNRSLVALQRAVSNFPSARLTDIR